MSYVLSELIMPSVVSDKDFSLQETKVINAGFAMQGIVLCAEMAKVPALKELTI